MTASTMRRLFVVIVVTLGARIQAHAQDRDVAITPLAVAGRHFWGPGLIASRGNVLVCTLGAPCNQLPGNGIWSWRADDANASTPAVSVLCMEAGHTDYADGYRDILCNPWRSVAGGATIIAANTAIVEFRYTRWGTPILYDNWRHDAYVATSRGWMSIYTNGGGSASQPTCAYAADPREGLIAGVVRTPSGTFVMTFDRATAKRTAVQHGQLDRYACDALIPVRDNEMLVVASSLLLHVKGATLDTASTLLPTTMPAQYQRLYDDGFVRLYPTNASRSAYVIESYRLDGRLVTRRTLALDTTISAITLALNERDSSIAAVYADTRGVHALFFDGIDLRRRGPTVRVNHDIAPTANLSAIILHDTLLVAWDGRRNDSLGIFGTAWPIPGAVHASGVQTDGPAIAGPMQVRDGMLHITATGLARTTIADAGGRIVLTDESADANGVHAIDVHMLPPGPYFVLTTSAGAIIRGAFLAGW